MRRIHVLERLRGGPGRMCGSSVMDWLRLELEKGPRSEEGWDKEEYLLDGKHCGMYLERSGRWRMVGQRLVQS